MEKKEILNQLYKDELDNLFVIHGIESNKGHWYHTKEEEALDVVLHVMKGGNADFLSYHYKRDINAVIQAMENLSYEKLMIGGPLDDILKLRAHYAIEGSLYEDLFLCYKGHGEALPEGFDFCKAVEEDRETVEEMMIDFFEAETDEDKARIREKLDLKTVYLLKDGKSCLGMGRFYAETAHYIDLTGIYIKPSERNKGYGKRLMQGMIHHCLALDKLPVLQVDKANEPAIHLYEQMGFKRHMDYSFQLVDIKKKQR